MSEKKLRIGYVPEHFSSPLLQLAENDDSIELISCPSGTGQIITAFDQGKIDVAIALTEALIAGIAKGNKNYKLIGMFVKTPLNWAIITGHSSKYDEAAQLRHTPIGISRIGSGSQVMASVLALREKWYVDTENKIIDKLEFKVNDTFEGLRNSVNDGSTSCFMWEWFTTKPYSDTKEVRFIGNIHTPWPSWMITATPNSDTKKLKTFLSRLSTSVCNFDSEESRRGSNIDFIKKTLGYPEADIKAWLETVRYPNDCSEIKQSVITDTLGVLELTGLITKPDGGWNLDDFVDKSIAKVT